MPGSASSSSYALRHDAVVLARRSSRRRRAAAGRAAGSRAGPRPGPPRRRRRATRSAGVGQRSIHASQTGSDPGHRRLLQHDLGDEDAPRRGAGARQGRSRAWSAYHRSRRWCRSVRVHGRGQPTTGPGRGIAHDSPGPAVWLGRGRPPARYRGPVTCVPTSRCSRAPSGPAAATAAAARLLGTPALRSAWSAPSSGRSSGSWACSTSPPTGRPTPQATTAGATPSATPPTATRTSDTPRGAERRAAARAARRRGARKASDGAGRARRALRRQRRRGHPGSDGPRRCRRHRGPRADHRGVTGLHLGGDPDDVFVTITDDATHAVVQPALPGGDADRARRCPRRTKPDKVALHLERQGVGPAARSATAWVLARASTR